MTDMQVTLLDHMGSDLSVVNAARVSFDKESTFLVSKSDCCGGTLREEDECCGGFEYLNKDDTKLISYLAKHNHWSPFSHAFISFRIKAPIFVARQLAKHQVGLAWNEVSRRYVDSEPEFYTPILRKRAENVKQGSSDEFPVNLDYCDNAVAYITERAKLYYTRLLAEGVCPEQARMVLPQSMMTEWIWSGSLYAFSRVCKLRLDSHTQKETRFIAEQIATHVEPLFPVSWKALNG